MRLILARHGETDYNQEWRYQGRTDIGLNRTGRRQAERLRHRLSLQPLDVIYTSKLKRAGHTAAVIARRRGVPVRACDELAELDFGKLEGLTYDEIVARYPDWKPDEDGFDAYGGENLAQLARRIKAFEKKLRGDNPAEAEILIVAHGGPLRVLLCRLLGLNIENWRYFRLAPGSLTEVEDFGNQPVLTRLNDVSHIKIKYRE
ncbi:MAG: histidine phosphatase family protein [Dehalococcoidia bacterium]|jgi:alpha-ribazole phosphatase